MTQCEFLARKRDRMGLHRKFTVMRTRGDDIPGHVSVSAHAFGSALLMLVVFGQLFLVLIHGLGHCTGYSRLASVALSPRLPRPRWCCYSLAVHVAAAVGTIYIIVVITYCPFGIQYLSLRLRTSDLISSTSSMPQLNPG